MSQRTKATSEERASHNNYARIFSGWIHALEQSAELGDEEAIATLAKLREQSGRGERDLLKPLRLDEGYGFGRDDEDENSDPIEKLAITPAENYDHRADVGTYTLDEVDAVSGQFGAALRWAAEGRPDLLVMGARCVTIFRVMLPEIVGAMPLPEKAMMQREFQLRAALGTEVDPRVTGHFYRRLLVCVRDCTSLGALGQRGYSLIYLVRNDLLGGMTCEEIGALKGGDGDTRQAANKVIQEIRDTLRGFRNVAMRDDETRKRCKRSQLKRSRN